MSQLDHDSILFAFKRSLALLDQCMIEGSISNSDYIVELKALNESYREVIEGRA